VTRRRAEARELRARPGPAHGAGLRRQPGGAHLNRPSSTRTAAGAPSASRSCTRRAADAVPRGGPPGSARASRAACRVELLDFIDDMADAYAAADVVVCRAGATSIAELTVLGHPGVLVPYPHATGDHQTAQRPCARAGGWCRGRRGRRARRCRLLVAAVEPWLTDPTTARAVAARLARLRPTRRRANVARLVLDLDPEDLTTPRPPTTRPRDRRRCRRTPRERRPASTSWASAAPACPASPASCSSAATRSPAPTCARAARSTSCAPSAPGRGRPRRAANLGDAELVVISTAVPADNPEVSPRPREGRPVLRRAEMLAGADGRERAS
jgi:hypothetical protein